MKRFLKRFLALALAGAALSAGPAAAAPSRAGEPPGAPRPWLAGLRWVNVPPLRVEDLAGKVVVVEFWTFDCINCRRTVPAMRALAAGLGGARDVAVIGIHTPELDHERDAHNVRRAVERLDLKFPVAQDNDFRAWKAFDNHYWPALYVLDRKGKVRFNHVGELHLGTADWESLLQRIAELRKEPA